MVAAAVATMTSSTSTVIVSVVVGIIVGGKDGPVGLTVGAFEGLGKTVPDDDSTTPAPLITSAGHVEREKTTSRKLLSSADFLYWSQAKN